MQQSWRQDADKLTFIACLPLPSTSNDRLLSFSEDADAPERMIGDTNLFLRFDDDDDDDDDSDKTEEKRVIGEIELMIAEKRNQGQGFGRGALLTFLWYITRHEREILDEFVQSTANAADDRNKKSSSTRKMKCLSVKIGKDNARSLALFESLGFEKRSPEPNYFEEFELRRYGLDGDAVVRLADTYGLKDYRELDYKDE